MERLRGVALAVPIFLAACTSPFFNPIPTIKGANAVLAISQLAPNPAKLGDVVHIDFSTGIAAAGCLASIRGEAATCTAAGLQCQCTFTVKGTTIEGTSTVSLSASGPNGTLMQDVTLQIDLHAPSIDASLFSILRHAVGSNDQLLAGAGASTDDSGDPYAGRGVAAYLYFHSATETTPFLTLTPGADGSLMMTDIPNSDGTTPATLAPGDIWVSAVDVPGNESARAEIMSGKDTAAPTVNGNLVTILRRDLTARDGVDGSPGALNDGTSAILTVKLFDAAMGGNLVGSEAPQADGGFLEIPIGTNTTVQADIWVTAVDKCGNESLPVPAHNNRSLATPSVAGTHLDYYSNPHPTSDTISGNGAIQSGFASTPQQFVTGLQFYDAPSGGTLLASTTQIAPDGSFGPIDLGNTNAARIYVVALDKSGGSTPRVYASHVHATMNLGGRLAHDNLGATSTPVQMFQFAADADMITGNAVVAGVTSGSVFPGIGPAKVDEDILDAPKVAAMDVMHAPFSVSTITTTTAGTWSGPTAVTGRYGHAMAYDVGRAKPVFSGGLVDNSGALPQTDVWEFSGSWMSKGSTGVKLANHALVYDSSLGVLFSFGGSSMTNSPTNATYLYSGTLPFSAVSAQGTLPAVRANLGMSYDSTLQRSIMADGSGWNGVSGIEWNDTWQFDGTTWTDLQQANGNSGNYDEAMAYDAGRGVTVMYGGDPPQNPAVGSATAEMSWLGWQAPVCEGCPPGARKGGRMTYDSVRRKIQLFGGSDGTNAQASFYEYDGASWSAIAAPGPTGRYYHGMTYDPVNQQTVVFGGTNNLGATSLADAWTYQRIDPHARWAVHEFVFTLDAGHPASLTTLTVDSLAVTYYGKGSGDNGGGTTNGVDLYVWQWGNFPNPPGPAPGWFKVGSNATGAIAKISGDTSAILPPPFLSGMPTYYSAHGKIWLMAVPTYPSSAPPSTAVQSTIDTDYVEIVVSYTI